MPARIGMYLNTIHCDEGTDELTPDEPYVLVTIVDLAAFITVAGFPVPLPSHKVVLHGPFAHSTKGQTKFAHFTPDLLPSFWGVSGTPAPLEDPDKAIFVVSLMERDDGDPDALRGIVQGEVSASVLGNLTFDRATKVTALINDVNSALGTPTGFPNVDDKIGASQELRFSGEELIQAGSGRTVSKTLIFEGDGGRYTLTFEARTFERQLRRFLQTRGFNLSRGISIRSLEPPVTSLRALMEV